MLAVSQRDGRHHLMRLSGHFVQHARRMIGVARFLKHFTVQNNDGICSQHGKIAWHTGHARLRFLARQARHILLSAFALSTLFFNAGNDAFKRDP